MSIYIYNLYVYRHIYIDIHLYYIILHFRYDLAPLAMTATPPAWTGARTPNPAPVDVPLWTPNKWGAPGDLTDIGKLPIKLIS